MEAAPAAQLASRSLSPFLGVGACHCTDCQKASGGGPLCGVWRRRARWRQRKGKQDCIASTGDSGAEVARAFCSDCGTPLWNMPAHEPFLTVKLGALDDNFDLTPGIAHLCRLGAKLACHRGRPPLLCQNAAANATGVALSAHEVLHVTPRAQPAPQRQPPSPGRRGGKSRRKPFGGERSATESDAAREPPARPTALPRRHRQRRAARIAPPHAGRSNSAAPRSAPPAVARRIRLSTAGACSPTRWPCAFSGRTRTPRSPRRAPIRRCAACDSTSPRAAVSPKTRRGARSRAACGRSSSSAPASTPSPIASSRSRACASTEVDHPGDAGRETPPPRRGGDRRAGARRLRGCDFESESLDGRARRVGVRRRAAEFLPLARRRPVSHRAGDFRRRSPLSANCPAAAKSCSTTSNPPTSIAEGGWRARA